MLQILIIIITLSGININPNIVFRNIQTTNNCGNNSFENKDGECECNNGYTWLDLKDSDNLDCRTEAPNEVCYNSYGSNSYSKGEKNNGDGYLCYCNKGYMFNKEGSECIKIRCGINSYRDINKECVCEEGFIWKVPEDEFDFNCVKDSSVI